jgi:hypothetical protein
MPTSALTTAVDHLKRAIGLLEPHTPSWDWLGVGAALNKASASLIQAIPDGIQGLSPIDEDVCTVRGQIDRARSHVQRHDRIKCLKSTRAAVAMLQLCLEREAADDPRKRPIRKP